MLVYEHTGGRTLDSLADDEITDELLRDTWHQCAPSSHGASRTAGWWATRFWWIVPARSS